MKATKRVLALVIALVLALSVMSISAITVSADSDVFFKFTKEAEKSQNGLTSITYTDSGMTFVSPDDSYEKCGGRLTEEERSYIQAEYDLSDEATQSALATVQSDKTTYRITCDINLKNCVGVGKTGKDYIYTDWKRVRDANNNYIDEETVKKLGYGVEAILIYNGKDAEGKDVSFKTETTVSPVEHPKKTLSTNLPTTFKTIESVIVRFGQGSDAVVGVRSLNCEISNLKMTKLSKPSYAMKNPESDCIVDYSNAYIYQLGSARMAISGMVTANVDESTELYPNSAYTFQGKGFVGPDCFKHGWEDMGVKAMLKDGALANYDGFEFYVISRKTDTWTVAFTILAELMVPNRDKNGNYLDAKGKVVATEAEALKIPLTFRIPEKDSPAAHPGTIMKFQFKLEDFEPQFDAFMTYIKTSSYGRAIGEYYDKMLEDKTMNLKDYSKYITSISTTKGLYAFTGEANVDFSVGDIYGCKVDEYGELSSNMPAPATYVDPNAGNEVDADATKKVADLYNELKDCTQAMFEADASLLAKLNDFVSQYNALNAKSKISLEKDHGIKESDCSPLIAISAILSIGDFDSGDSGFGFGLGSPATGASTPVAIAVATIGALAVLFAVKRKKD